MLLREDWVVARKNFHEFADVVKEFEQSLSESFLVGAVVDGIAFALERLSLRKTGYLVLHGYRLDNSPFCHVRPAKLPLLTLIALPRPEGEKGLPRRPIGFDVHDSESESESESE